MIETALKNGISRSVYRHRLRLNWTEERAATQQVKERLAGRYLGEYAVYRNDEIVAMGTAEECATELNVSAEYIRWMTTPSGMKRLANRKNPDQTTSAVKLDED